MCSQASEVAQVPQYVHAEPHDILTNFPSEILLKVICQVPTTSFLDLVHTSKPLRNFLKINASRICNEIIRERFPMEAKLLKSEVVAGWLVPTCHGAQTEDDDYVRFMRPLLWVQWRPGSVEIYVDFSLVGMVDIREAKEAYIRITSPGPQYLFFLESNVLDLKLAQETQGNLLIREKGYRLLPDKEWGNKFATFTRRFNDVQVEVKSAKFLPSSGRMKGFPRQLVWFYGVERLRVKIKNEDEDWKNLPMLLWD